MAYFCLSLCDCLSLVLWPPPVRWLLQVLYIRLESSMWLSPPPPPSTTNRGVRKKNSEMYSTDAPEGRRSIKPMDEPPRRPRDSYRGHGHARGSLIDLPQLGKKEWCSRVLYRRSMSSTGLCVCLIGRLSNLLDGWLVDWLVDWLTDWLISFCLFFFGLLLSWLMTDPLSVEYCYLFGWSVIGWGLIGWFVSNGLTAPTRAVDAREQRGALR